MPTRRLYQLCLFLSLCLLMSGPNGCSKPQTCTNEVSSLTIDPTGSPCEARCDCNNQLYVGFCNTEKLCESTQRKDCTQKEEKQSCILLKIDAREGCTTGIQVCQPEELTTKKWGDCRPITRIKAEDTPELCFDGIDNDCDGKYDKFDEDCKDFCQPNTKRPCYTGADSTRNRGICKLGVETCKADGRGWGSCLGEILPEAEKCNGRDDNCNGIVDENPDGCKCNKEGETGPCYGGPEETLNKGICTPGVRTCIKKNDNLFWSPCAGDITPQVENCDGIDNDCNGQVDDNKKCNPCGLPGTTQACFTGKLHQRNRGICRDGLQICGEDGIWTKCQNETLPEARNLKTGKLCASGSFDGNCEEDRCDGKDNDCDGIVDETCPYRACNKDDDCALIPQDKGRHTCKLNRCVTDNATCTPTCRTDQRCVQGTCTCETGKSVCAGLCTDTRADDKHCGKCNNTCPTGQTCQNGACTCPAGQSSCDGACTNTNTNNKHCGKCNNICPSGQTCQNGACGCPSGQTACGGQCVSTKTDNKHCGTCNNACLTGQTCQSGACTCNTGLSLCNGTCSNTQIDANHCGACSNPCPTGQSCAAGKCTCPNNNPPCGTQCPNTQTDTQHCGACNNTCPPLSICTAGKCSCNTGLTLCNAQCINTQSDDKHCGNCGNTCPAGQNCLSGTCKITSCPSGQALCSNTCKNIRTDATNCGNCGNTCPPGQTCQSGLCLCPPGQLSCSNVCKDIRADAANCGNCGVKCPAGQTCQNGTCNCPLGNAYCSGLCIDIRTNSKHCGACGATCTAGLVCTNGVCSCPSGQQFCNGRCVNTSTDTNNCGSCNNYCPSAQTCKNGACTCSTGLSYCSPSCVNLDTDNNNCSACGLQCNFNTTCTTISCTAPQLCPSHNCQGDCKQNGCPDGLTCNTQKVCVGWSQSIGITTGNNINPIQISADSSGNIFILGNFAKTVTFGTITLTSKGSLDLFVLKLSPQGKVLWAKRAGGSGYDEGLAMGVIITGLQVFITGQLIRTATSTQPDFLNASNANIAPAVGLNNNFFFAVLNGSTGNFEAVKVVNTGGNSIAPSSIFVQFSSSRLINVFIAGVYRGVTGFSFDPQNSKILTPTATYASTAFVVHYDQFGNYKNSAKIDTKTTLDHLTLTLLPRAQQQSNDTLILTGSYSRGVTGTRSSPARTFTLTSVGNGQDIFIARFDVSTFDLLNLISVGGPGTDKAGALIPSKNPNDTPGTLYMTGSIQGNGATFGTKSLPASTTTSNSYAFIAKLLPNDQFESVYQLANAIVPISQTHPTTLLSDNSSIFLVAGEGAGSFGSSVQPNTTLVTQNVFLAAFDWSSLAQKPDFKLVTHSSKLGTQLPGSVFHRSVVNSGTSLLWLARGKGNFSIPFLKENHNFQMSDWGIVLIKVPLPNIPGSTPPIIP